MPRKEQKCSANTDSVQELASQQLFNLESELRELKRTRKDIEKKRKEAQVQSMELEHKQAVCQAKFDNVVSLKEMARNTMQDLRTEVQVKQRKIEELEKKLAAIQRCFDKIKEYFAEQAGSKSQDEAELKAKIDEALIDIHDMIKYNSTKSDGHSEQIQGLTDASEKRLEARVYLETLKNRDKFVRDTQERELEEKQRLDEKLQKLRTCEAEKCQEKEHLMGIIKRERCTIEKIVHENEKLVCITKELQENYDEQKDLIKKLARELTCAKHDEKNLEAMTTEADCRLAVHRAQMQAELEKRNCLMKSVAEKEIDLGADILEQSCLSSLSEDVTSISCPTLSTTYMDTIDSKCSLPTSMTVSSASSQQCSPRSQSRCSAAKNGDLGSINCQTINSYSCEDDSSVSEACSVEISSEDCLNINKGRSRLCGSSSLSTTLSECESC